MKSQWRIAFSATCAIACMLLCLLWFRSYWRSDSGRRLTPKGSYTLTSFNGTLVFSNEHWQKFDGFDIEWTLARTPEAAPTAWFKTAIGFGWRRDTSSITVA